MLPRTERVAIPLLALLPAGLRAQGRGMELHLGQWYNGNRAHTYEFRTSSRLGGAFMHGFGVTVLVHDSLGRHRAFYGLGWEAQGWRGRSPLAPYALTGIALGLSTDTATHQLAALWTVGGGLEWRPLSWLALGTEVRYRLEDRGPRGFWNPRSDARKGISAAIGIGLGLGRRETGRRRGGTPLVASLPLEPPTTVAGNAGDIVQTAIEALGTPYVWGGTADNGFDCSGLIQYAYGRHGIRLPRMSRDQAKAGAEVAPVVEGLRPGDILLFSSRPGAGVTHVGMYVGELKFIHSSGLGVKLSRLDSHDPEGGYWLDRWVGARRIMP